MTPEPDLVSAYGQAAESWGRGATLVYGPLADALLGHVGPDDWLDGPVLDVGTGAGVVSRRLTARGVRTVAVDLSEDMVRLERHERPPGLVADIGSLPLAASSAAGVAAAFVLNHVSDPVGVLTELARVSRPGALIVISVFSSTSAHIPRDRIDDVATRWGWSPPDWYTELTTATAPLLASGEAMTRALAAAGLAVVSVDERQVDVGVTTAEQLVAYRLAQAHIAGFLADLGPRRGRQLATEAVEAVGEPMEPYRPTVVFGAARR